MIDAAIVGLGRWGKNFVEAVQGKSDRIRFVRGVDAAPGKLRDFVTSRRSTVFASVPISRRCWPIP